MSDARRRRTASLALVSFSLSAIVPGPRARASSTSGVSIGPGSESIATTTTSTVLTVGTTVVGIVLLIKLATDVDGGTPEGRTRALLDGGLLNRRGDLGMELGLLVDSPAAFHQISDEVAAGGGPGLDALVQATGLPHATVARAWTTTSAALPPATDADAATRFVVRFLATLAPELQVQPEHATALLDELRRERLRPDFPADAPAHLWLARWLGVPEHAVADATAELGAAGLADGAAHARLRAEHDRLLDAIAARVAATHHAEVEQRIAALAAEVEPWLAPPVDASVADGDAG